MHWQLQQGWRDAMTPTSTSRHMTLRVERWQRLGLGVRCAYNPDQPRVIRCWLSLGQQLVAQGAMPAVATQRRMLDVLLATANDDALPWFWRSVCLEHVNLPLARLQSALRLDAPLAAQAIDAAVDSARRRFPLCTSAHEPHGSWFRARAQIT